MLALFQVELGSITDQLKLKLVAVSCGVIGWETLNDDGVALSSVGLKDEVFKLHHVEDSLALCLCGILILRLPSVYQAQVHVLEEVLVAGHVNLEMQGSVGLGDLEIVLAE